MLHFRVGRSKITHLIQTNFKGQVLTMEVSFVKINIDKLRSICRWRQDWRPAKTATLTPSWTHIAKGSKNRSERQVTMNSKWFGLWCLGGLDKQVQSALTNRRIRETQMRLAWSKMNWQVGKVSWKKKSALKFYINLQWNLIVRVILIFLIYYIGVIGSNQK